MTLNPSFFLVRNKFDSMGTTGYIENKIYQQLGRMRKSVSSKLPTQLLRLLVSRGSTRCGALDGTDSELTEGAISQFDTSRADGQFRKPASNKKLLSLIGENFKFTPFEDALRETVQWLVEHYDTDARIGRTNTR
jgi:hypothetical protein